MTADELVTKILHINHNGSLEEYRAKALAYIAEFETEVRLASSRPFQEIHRISQVKIPSDWVSPK